MTNQTHLSETISARFAEVMGTQVPDQDLFKTVTVRLSLEDYATLKTLASRLSDTVSNMGKVILSSAVQDAAKVYCQLGCVDDDGSFEQEFALDCHESLLELVP